MDQSNDDSNFDHLSSIGDGEACNGVVAEPDLDTQGNLKLIDFNRRVPVTVSLVPWSNNIV